MAIWYRRILPLMQSLPSLISEGMRVDFEFYGMYYEDLRGLSSKELIIHYQKHGKKEGRHPNPQALIAELQREHGRLPPNFDPKIYGILNPDLARAFRHESQLIGHYLMHGRKEGRNFNFLSEDLSSAPAGAWQSIFDVSHFTSWNADWLPSTPLTRGQALNLFLKEGIEKLSPINLDYIFDPSFYRERHKIKGGSDVQLYRQWLFQDFEHGLAPNEIQATFPFLNGHPYPENFDWKRYAKEQTKDKNADKIDALRSLYAAPFSMMQIRPYFDGDFRKTLLSLGVYFSDNGRDREAKEALAISIDSGENKPAIWHRLGGACSRLGLKQEAIHAFEQASSMTGSSVSSIINAIRLHLNEKDHDAAFDLIAKHGRQWIGNVEYRDTVNWVVRHYYNYENEKARKALLQSFREGSQGKKRAAEKSLMAALQKISAVLSDTFNLTCSPVRENGDHVAVLANKDLLQCTYYRVDQRELQFEAIGKIVKTTSHNNVEDFIPTLLGARASVFYRVPATPDIIFAILSAKSLGIKTYYEIDDLIFDSDRYPDDFQTFGGQVEEDDYISLQHGAVLTRFAMSLCDNAIASTPCLKKEMEKHVSSGQGVLIRNGLDPRSDWLISLGQERGRLQFDEIRIFYGSGTKAHNTDFAELAGPALLQLMRTNSNIRLIIVGYLQLDLAFNEFKDRIERYEFIENIDQYWSILATCDVNIAVLHKTIFNDCKSEIKWLEAAVLQIPSVVSATATYLDVVTHGEDGLIAENVDDWLDGLTKLISSPSLRQAIGARARLKALQRNSLSTLAGKVADEFFSTELTEKPATCLPRRRLLISNVFYAPQTIGGATRVVEDNVKYITSNYADEFDITIIATDEGIRSPGEVRYETVDGVSVIRISVPQEVRMDTKPFNELHKAFFRDAIKHVQPDLIHFHCIQRLTASFVETAIELEVPYLITLHDGWWISEHQFLVDDNGFLVLPNSSRAAADLPVSTKPRTLERQQKLAVLLKKAKARLSVSKPFADIYAAAEIDNVEVLENGVTPLEAIGPANRPDGRVALAHIGGRAAHKGAFLLEAVLRHCVFQNLHLTMIDGRLPYGESIETVWGTTPVVLKGPYPQKAVRDLYREINVLIAPSTWPESYGLVSREAASLGRWVVASKIGAMGEAVEPDKNGFLVDTSDLNDLRAVLEKIDSDPAHYMTLAPRSHELRSSDQQARDLIALYRSLT
jgi:glycosyltransferase involved in cell wall biosynthesis